MDEDGDDLFVYGLTCVDCQPEDAEHGYNGALEIARGQRCENEKCRHPLIRHHVSGGGAAADPNDEFELPRFVEA
jgi:hypothetical protein